jgi:hypothetical protein
MRRLFARWIAIVALVAGVGVGATALPASAATPSSSSHTGTTSVHGVQPDSDWWF